MSKTKTPVRKERRYAKIDAKPDAPTPGKLSAIRIKSAEQDVARMGARLTAMEQSLAKLVLSGEIMADALNQSKVRAHIRTQWYDTLKAIKLALAAPQHEANP
jgi:hypothetical protein